MSDSILNIDTQYYPSEAENKKFVTLSDDALTSMGYSPDDGDEKQAVLVYSVSSGINGGYQDTVLNSQIELSTTAQQITANESKGYVKLRIESGGTCYIGNSSVTTSDGYLIDDDWPVESLSFENLSDVYVLGSGTLYVVGGYIA